MAQRVDLCRAAALAVMALLAAAMGRHQFGSSGELTSLQSREQELARRCATTCADDDDDSSEACHRPGGGRDDAGSVDPARAVALIEELRRVRTRITDLETSWW